MNGPSGLPPPGGKKKRGWKVLLWLVPLLGFCICTGSSFPAMQRADRANMKEGDRLVAALEAHRADAGAYPEKLTDLVPAHLTEVPRAVSYEDRPPDEFNYSREAETYRLSFDQPGAAWGFFAGGYYVWDRSTREWTLIPD